MFWVLLVSLALVLLSGTPVAFALAGVSLCIALLASALGAFDVNLLLTIPQRLYGVVTNVTLLAVPLFVLMGTLLEKSKLSQELLQVMMYKTANIRGNLAFSVLLVGGLLAATTGIVGATVIMLGLIALPAMLKSGYDQKLASGLITATGTLGQIIPPSVALVILGDVMSTAYQHAQLSLGNFNPQTVSIGQLFFGAIVPGLCLLLLYALYILAMVVGNKRAIPMMSHAKPPITVANGQPLVMVVMLPILLILLVLGSILFGVATPTEAAGVGATAALLLVALRGRLTQQLLVDVSRETAKITAMVFSILIGASIFALVVRGLGGDHLIAQFVTGLEAKYFALFLVMLLIFVLGFFLDFIEIIFVVLPIVCPPLLMLGIDPIWLGILIAINLQTSFMTPPFGFALFYLRGVAPPALRTVSMYKGVVPFIVMQWVILLLVFSFPQLVTWLPNKIFN